MIRSSLKTSLALKKLLAALVLASAGFVQAGEIIVSAASSLTNVFKDVVARYESAHPDSRVLLNFGASGALLQQMSKGAPVDVFASADQETMDAALKLGLVATGSRQDFARNTLVLVVPVASKLSLGSLHDLTLAGVQKVAYGNPASVPVGRYTQHALETAKLWSAIEPKGIQTQNARQTLDYVARGEVDAGFVYGTDAALMPDKVKVAFVVPLDVVILYPMATLSGSSKAREAGAFIRYVMSPEGQAIFAQYGFGKP